MSGSDATCAYILYSNSAPTSVTLPGTGSSISFTGLGSSGVYNVVASNKTSTATAFMNGSATISIAEPPAITAEPANEYGVVGGLSAFSVQTTGSADYQWYRNSTALTNGGNISGTQTASLIINPVGNSDAQPYFCQVTNSCGVLTNSTTNSLAVHTAGNLFWVGAVSSNWDVAGTANWASGSDAGPGAVFNYGDNVTFDNNSTNQTVVLNGVIVGPGTMTVAGGGYAFTGAGTIEGPGSLAVNSGATLNLYEANTFTGGTIINGGTVVFSNAVGLSGLGSGNVTLENGGTILFIPSLGYSASIGLSNNVNVPSSSTIQYNGTGSSTAASILGQLTGSPGAQLTIYHPALVGSTDRIRAYGSFTNAADMIFSTGGSDVLWAPYQSSGVQEYDGRISGSGAIISRNNSAAVTLFNNGNSTYNSQNNASFYLSQGAVGVGADSASSSPPTVDHGPLGIGPIVLTTELPTGAANSSTTPNLFASGGPHIIHNPINYIAGTNTVIFRIGGNNDLTLAGSFELAGTVDATVTNRQWDVTNTGNTTFSGVIDDLGLGFPVTKTGGGSLYLNGANTYTGVTTNAGGLLAGSGSLLGPVVVSNTAVLGGGSAASIGVLTISNSLTLNGNLLFRVNTSGSPANDSISVTGTLVNTGSGSLTVNNLGPALLAGTKFFVFNKALAGGAALTVTGGGVTWSNSLAVDGSISIPSQPTFNANSVAYNSGSGNLSFSGTGGVPGAGYTILGSTNIAARISTWSVVQSGGHFAADGSFTVTLPINPSVPPQKFFTIRSP